MSDWDDLFIDVVKLQKTTPNLNQFHATAKDASDEITEMRCAVQIGSSVESFAMSMSTGFDTGQVFCSYEDATKIINRGYQLVYDGNLWDITGAVNAAGRKEVMILSIQRKIT